MESCGDLECLICYPLVTKAGRVITAGELAWWADEAEEKSA